ncbi:MAG TPA: DNA-protecting protein DprA [Clostridiaceae bacterium]|nr:DNA-protecting protein DprA [Clostridiaceae bacterium]
MKNNLLPWVWLSMLPGVSPVKRKMLIDFFKDAENVWNATIPELKLAPFLTGNNIKQIISPENREEAGVVYKATLYNKIEIITFKSEIYPECLKNTYDPPVVLYVRGKLIPDEHCIGIVGSRRATCYGLEMAENIAFELAQAGITVVSGMARGIDSHAHYGAIKAGGRTIAVFGCGLDTVYPKENSNLMEQIIKSGAVISEYTVGTQPLNYNFPARNRIISGLSLGVAVIEAGEKSGSLITADYALEQGREVFAVPGNINRWNSKGTNNLIKEGAKMVTCADDILEEISYIENIKRKINISGKSNIISNIGKDERKILDILKYEELHIDDISELTGISINTLNSLVIMMELKGLVEQMPGNIYRLKK